MAKAAGRRVTIGPAPSALSAPPAIGHNIKRFREPVTLTGLPVPPSVNALFANRNQKDPEAPRFGFGPAPKRKRGRKITPAYAAWKHLAIIAVNQQTWKPIGGRVQITITVCEHQSKADIDNLAKAPIDLMVQMGVIEEDRGAVVRRVITEWGDAPGVRLHLEPV